MRFQQPRLPPPLSPPPARELFSDRIHLFPSTRVKSTRQTCPPHRGILDVARNIACGGKYSISFHNGKIYLYLEVSVHASNT